MHQANRVAFRSYVGKASRFASFERCEARRFAYNRGLSFQIRADARANA